MMTEYLNLKKLPRPELELRPEDLECYLINYSIKGWQTVFPTNYPFHGSCRAIYRLCQEIKMLRGWK